MDNVWVVWNLQDAKLALKVIACFAKKDLLCSNNNVFLIAQYGIIKYLKYKLVGVVDNIVYFA